MRRLLDDRCAVVTGGSSGIGRAIARAFARRGAEIVVADIREEPREGGCPTAELVTRDYDAGAEFVECDVANPADLERAVAAADEFGGIDVMVNNAGVYRHEEFLEVTEREFDELVDVNAKSVFFGAQAAARRMTEADGGSIINLSSIEGVRGGAANPTYSMTKGAVRALTFALGAKLARDGVTVNCIHPGGIRTALTENEGAESADEMGHYFDGVPMGEWGEPHDVAGAAVYLASDLSSYVNAEAIFVDGGYKNTI
jgi:NAD(P)-dependent dehydrogenase (short-subunit alcohol dehydrogenase family)